MTLHDEVRRFLRRRGKSQEQWARELGISKGYLSKILVGTSVPALPLAVRMSEDSGIAVAKFAEGRKA